MSATVFQRIWLPGFIFKSVLIGGGYATGRELVEFFLSAGPIGGLLAMAVATIGFSLIAALTFELARLSRSHNYRSFFQQLLGRAWFLFEIAYCCLAILVLAVLASAAGEIVADHLGTHRMTGAVALMLVIAVLVFWGTPLIERVLAGWSYLLYATYAIFVGLYLTKYGHELPAKWIVADTDKSWLSGGLLYVGYSMAVIPLILFSVKHMQSRRDALTAGLLAGPLAMIPAVLFALAMTVEYPRILEVAVPADFMIRRLDVPWLSGVFYIVVFGTFIETGTAFIHAINERIYETYSERNRTMPRWLRPAVALGALLGCMFLADRVGLIDLIARGYGTLSYFFVLIFLVPLLTVGVWRIRRGPVASLGAAEARPSA